MSARPRSLHHRFHPRQISGDGQTFGFSTFTPGVLAFSRILNDREVVVILNLSKSSGQTLHVIVDATLASGSLATWFSSRNASDAPPVERIAQASVEEIDGSTSHGGVAAVRVDLAAAEVRILG